MDASRRDAHSPVSPEAADPVAHVVNVLRSQCLKHADSRCLLMVDPACRPLPDRPDAGLMFSEQARADVPVMHDAFPREHWPYLVELDVSTRAGVALLTESVRLAFEDREPEDIARGQGQRIGGWLTTTEPVADVAAHLSRLVLQQDDRGRTCALRFYDSRALSLIWPILGLGQQQVLLAPVAAWHALDACGQLHTYVAADALRTELELTGDQWHAIRRHGPINKALGLHMYETGRQPNPTEVDAAVAAAGRAEQYGLTDPEDAVAFVGHALAWHPQFDLYPKVLQILSRMNPGEFYVAAVDDLTSEEIAEIQQGAWYDRLAASARR